MSYNIVKHAGEVKQITLENGTVIERQEALFVDAWGVMVKCAPYDNHFIYRNPDTSEGSSAFLCTCGNPGIVVPPSPAGLFVCLFDYNTGLKGQHATSLYNLKDWQKVRGQTLDTNKIRGELI